MTDIGGTKTVYTPVTPSVDNNAKPASGTPRGAVGAGLLQPSPNTAWVRGVVKHDAESEAKRAAFTANVKMGDRDQYLKNQVDAAPKQQFPQMQQVQQVQQEESSAGLSRNNNTVENARASSEKSLDAEAKHDEQIAQAKEEALQKLHDEDLLKERLQQLATPQGTTAPAA
jgi:hypothetical protein